MAYRIIIDKEVPRGVQAIIFEDEKLVVIRSKKYLKKPFEALVMLKG